MLMNLFSQVKEKKKNVKILFDELLCYTLIFEIILWIVKFLCSSRYRTSQEIKLLVRLEGRNIPSVIFN